MGIMEVGGPIVSGLNGFGLEVETKQISRIGLPCSVKQKSNDTYKIVFTCGSVYNFIFHGNYHIRCWEINLLRQRPN